MPANTLVQAIRKDKTSRRVDSRCAASQWQAALLALEYVPADVPAVVSAEDVAAAALALIALLAIVTQAAARARIWLQQRVHEHTDKVRRCTGHYACQDVGEGELFAAPKASLQAPQKRLADIFTNARLVVFVLGRTCLYAVDEGDGRRQIVTALSPPPAACLGELAAVACSFG